MYQVILYSALFRQEALDHQSEHGYGEAMISRPPFTSLLVTLFAAIVLSAAVAVCLTDYSRKQTALGQLVPDAGLIAVMAPQSGVFAEVYVREQQAVEKGQPLFSVIDEVRLENGSDVIAERLAKLDQQRRSLLTAIDDQQRQNELDAAALRRRETVLSSQLEVLERQLDNQRARVTAAARRKTDAAALRGRGLITVAQRNQVSDDYLTQNNQLLGFERERLERRAQLAALSDELQKLAHAGREQIGQLSRTVLDIERQRDDASARRAVTVRAPAAGLVTALQANPGAAAAGTRAVLKILPQGSHLVAHLYLPTRAAGFVNAGQTVAIRYDAFPYQRYGIHTGRVKDVTRSVINPSELPTLALNEPAYRVTVELPSQTVDATGHERQRERSSVPLRAGMLLRADVIYDTRSVLQWLLEPIADLRGDPT